MRATASGAPPLLVSRQKRPDQFTQTVKVSAHHLRGGAVDERRQGEPAAARYFNADAGQSVPCDALVTGPRPL